MNRKNKISNTIIVSCILILSLSIPAFAEPSDNDPSNTGTPSSTSSSTSGGSHTTSSTSSSASHTSSTSSNTSSNHSSSVSSKKNSAVASVTINSSKKSGSGQTNQSITSIIPKVNTDDGVDTSGWGSGNDDSEPVVSKESTTSSEAKTGNKKIFDLAKLFWYTIWIPIALIIASVCALIHVNKKSFVTGAKNAPKNKNKKKNKKNSSQNRHTNIYRPRD